MLEVMHMVPPKQSARSFLFASILALLSFVIAPTLPAADCASARATSEASSQSGGTDETGLTRQPEVDPADERAFRLSRSDGKPRLLHPDGQPFVALGVNHIGMLASDREFFAKRYSRDWNRFREHLGQQFDRWNMNCIGYGAPTALQLYFPYFATITLAKIEKHRSDPNPNSPNGYRFPDPFDSEWAADVERRIGKMCERHRGNRLLIGYLR